jgi:hypothetical protein
MVKAYKHCCLADVITKEIASKICECDLRMPNNGFTRRRRMSSRPATSEVDFPLKASHRHSPDCGLLSLVPLLAASRAKFILFGPQVPKIPARLQKSTRKNGLKSSNNPEPVGLSRRASSRARPTYEYSSHSSLSYLKETGVDDNTEVAQKAAKESTIVHKRNKDAPAFLRPITDRIAFGNTHAALMFGPLVIENGVPGYAIIGFPLGS